MVKEPKVGRKYYIIEEVWGAWGLIPVTITEVTQHGDNCRYTAEWAITRTKAERYRDLTTKDLFESKKEAWAAINEILALESAVREATAR